MTASKPKPTKHLKHVVIEKKVRPPKAAPRQETPEWAHDIFRHARTVAWEGDGPNLQSAHVYPPTGSFLEEVALVRKGANLLWSESLHPLDRTRVQQKFSAIKSVPFNIEYRLVDNHGAVIWVRHTITAMEPDKTRTRLRGFVRDIQAEKELELESLRISEREQNRIGQDLHDDLCQVLAGLSCLMRVMEGRIGAKMPEEVPSLAEINTQIIEAMARTRALTHGLFPGKIQIADIRGALLELAGQVRARFQVQVSTQFAGRFPHHASPQIIHIYRLAQEAMSNAIKHGRATHIEVRLEAKNNTMFLEIADNGTGLAKGENDDQGVGMHIMHYRTRTLGGELDIRNGPERGVLVTLRYPFQH